MKIDLNCDLGEGEPLARTRALMRWITSANVACGGHAGDAATMAACVRLAKQLGVRLGAHPGPWSRDDHGRGAGQITPNELELLLLHQVGALEKLARAARVKLHHVKLHGALYHASEADEMLARCYVAAIKHWWPRVKIYALSGGIVARNARRMVVEVWEEAFADRAYRDDGSLVPRGEPGALLSDVPQVVERIVKMVKRNQVVAINGQVLRMRPRTICLHSDTPDALTLARAVGRLLTQATL